MQRLLKEYESIQHAADDLNDTFASVFTEPPDWEFVQNMITTDGLSWNVGTCITVGKTEQYLKKLKLRKSAGCDNLTARILRECSSALCEPLSHLFSQSISECYVPAEWKVGNVVPIPKSKAKTKYDLRPVTLLPIVAKILEKYVVSSVKTEIMEMYGDNQFGFRPQVSTLHAHLELHDYITSQLDQIETKGVLLISFDMMKAFDKLDYEALFRTLSTSAVPRRFLCWLTSYFMNRSQRVVLKPNVCSTSLPVTSGVPQGSVLGPYLFAAHVGSFSSVSPVAKVFKYADDIMIVYPFSNVNSCDQVFNAEMKHMTDWCVTNGLTLNAEKTKAMIIGHYPHPVTNSLSFSTKESLTFLGMSFTKALKWDNHIGNIYLRSKETHR